MVIIRFWYRILLGFKSILNCIITLKKIYIILFISLFVTYSAFSQNITCKIIDSNSNEIIPYANILINDKENLISNGEGFFTLSEKNIEDKTTITISYIGYITRKITVEELKEIENIIKLEPGYFELNEVTILNKKLNPYEIMSKVKANFKNNYLFNSKPKKDLIFFRESVNLIPKTLDIEIDKSSGFSKETLNTANAQMSLFTSKLLLNPPKQFTDLICNKYSYLSKKDGKSYYTSKLEVMKATKLKNEGNSITLDDLEKTAKDIVLKHLDSTKYYRVKSGLFGSRDTITLRKDFNQKKNRTSNNQLSVTKGKLESFVSLNSISNTSKYDFIHNPDYYQYTYEGTSFSDQNELIYKLSFKPKKSKAKYKGTLLISESDFAIIRVDYKLEEGKKVSGINLKFLLGVKSSENISNGKLIYKKNDNGDGYILQYLSQESGQYFYVNRPLKFIELTNDEKDVVAFDLKIEGNAIEKKEYLKINRSESTETFIENFKENDFKFIQIKEYDPKLWKEYSAIEPSEEMKQLKLID